MMYFQAVMKVKPRKPTRGRLEIPPDGILRRQVWAVDSWAAMYDFKQWIVEQGLDVEYFKMKEVE